MNKKIMLFAAVCLTAGMLMAGVGWLLGGRGFTFSLRSGFSFGRGEDYTYQNMDMEPFDEIYIKVRNCPVTIVPSKNGNYGVDVKLEKMDNEEITLDVVNGRLQILEEGGFQFLNWNFSFFEDRNYYVYVYVPEKVYRSVYVSTSNGIVKVEGVDAGDGTITVDTSNGGVTLTDIYAAKIGVDTSNAPVSMKNIRADMTTVDTTNGRVSFENVEAETIRVDSSNAGISFDTVYGSEAVLETSNGSVVLDTVHFVKRLEVDTSNSSIELLLDGEKQEYSIVADTSNSSVYVDNEKFDDDYKGGDGKAEINLDTSNGRITVKFK